MSLTVTRTYGANTVLTEAQLDAAFDSIEAKFNSTLIAGSEIQDAAIEADHLASNAVTLTKVLDGVFTADASGRAKFADSFVNTAKIADTAVTGAKIEASPTITTSVKITSSGPTLTSVSSKTLGISDGSTVRSAVVSTNPSTHGLMIVRGVVSSAGAVTRGEGFTVAQTGTGLYTITFSTAFTEAPAITVTSATTSRWVAVTAASTTTADIGITAQNGAGSPVFSDASFHFIAIGQRA